MKCIETIEIRPGMIRRRYLDEYGAEHTTYEVPSSVITEIGFARLTETLGQASRGATMRTRIARVRQLLEAKWKPAAIAHELQISEGYVRKIRGRRS